MRKTKPRFAMEVVQYVKERLAETDSIAIYAPEASDEDITFFRQQFKEVERKPLGYIHFKA